MITIEPTHDDIAVEADGHIPDGIESPPRRPRRLRWKILAAVGALAAVAGGAIGVDHANNSSHHSTRSFVEPITRLDVDISAGSVRVVGGSASTFTVDVTTHGGLRRPSHGELVVGDHLLLRSDCDFNLIAPTCSTDYVVHVPANIAIAVDSDGADVDLRFAAAPHSVEIDANGGDIDIVVPNDAETYNVDSETNGGSTDVDVRTDRESPNHIDISSNGGDIDVRYPSEQHEAG